MDLRAYRLGFAPTLAALVLLAFSLQGVPDPLEPVPGTIEFDAEQAGRDARGLQRRAPARAPGSPGADAGAELVRERFEATATGTVAEQTFEAPVNGDDVELRNVILTLPGASDRATVVLAGRDSRTEADGEANAAATGVLLELAQKLGVSGRERTLIFASVDGTSSTADGALEMLKALPERTAVDAVVVISQPGAAELSEPHLVTSSAGDVKPSLELIRTAEQALANRAELDAGLEGALAQIARLALPAATGVQAALLADGVNAIGVSGAGEVPPRPGDADTDQLSVESMERIGASVLGLAGAVEARVEALEDGPQTYLRMGNNVIPHWAVSLLALTLLIPPALPIALTLARSRGQNGSLRRGLSWVVEWLLVMLAPLLALYAAALVGLIPRPATPYDPGRFAIGPAEVAAMLVLVGIALAVWWTLGLRRLPTQPDPTTLGAVAGAVLVGVTLLAWLANPFLALLMVPAAHIVVIHGARRPAVPAIPAALAALIPLAAAVLYVGATLDWGSTAPWQLVLLVAGGGLGLVPVTCLLAALGASLAVVRSALASSGNASAGI